jgi:CRP-like cAMP-binding protein
MFKRDEKIERLRDIELFAACSKHDLQAIASIGDGVATRAGDVVRGVDRAFYVLTSGEAELGGASLHRGDSCGAVGLLGGDTESGTLSMSSDGNLLVVGSREFLTLMRRVPGFGLGVAKDLARLVGRTAS